MLAKAVFITGLIFGWDDAPNKEKCKIIECCPKRPTVSEVDEASKCCPDDDSHLKKFVFYEAAHFPDPRFNINPLYLQGGNSSAPLMAPRVLGRSCPLHIPVQGRPGMTVAPNQESSGMGPIGVPVLNGTEANHCAYQVDQNGKPLIIHEGMALWIYEKGKYRIWMKATVPDTAIDLRMQLEFNIFPSQETNDPTSSPLANSIRDFTNESQSAITKANPTNLSESPQFVANSGEIKTRKVNQSFRITLPPIVLARKIEDSLIVINPLGEVNDSSRVVTIVYEGFSELLASDRATWFDFKEKTSTGSKIPQVTLVRNGTARFGSPLPR